MASLPTFSLGSEAMDHGLRPMSLRANDFKSFSSVLKGKMHSMLHYRKHGVSSGNKGCRDVVPKSSCHQS